MMTCPLCGLCYEDEQRTCHRDQAVLTRTLPGPCRLADRYHVDQKLGAGGSGTVYRATHVGTGRSVALKILAVHLASHAEWQERFRREATAVGRLKHPNIVDVLDFGTSEVEGETVAFLAMEYLPGRPLSWHLRQGALPALQVERWIAQVASAVEFAHRAGILHRDLKPDNIWVEELAGGEQRIKVLDFGLAKILEAESPDVGETSAAMEPIAEAVDVLSLGALVAEPPPRTSLHPTIRFGDGFATPPAPTGAGVLTELGAVMGTPAYMSPEQAAGDSATAASDVYSLGVVAYEMLTGRLPFIGNTADLLDLHQSEPAPDPGRFAPRLPRSMRRALLRALEKDPARRPATPLEFVRELSGSLRIDEIAGRATLLYVGLVLLWGASYLVIGLKEPMSVAARAAAVETLAATNLLYFLALSLVLLLAEARREDRPERLWPLCLLAFPLTPVWLVLVYRARRRRAARERAESPLLHSAPSE